MSESTVCFSPVSSEKSEIRLLVLQPGHFDAGIECWVEKASLDEHPRYAAMSYCWGDLSEIKTIQINGEPFSISSNLESALRYLRTDFALTLWVDAICIDQNNAAEKNAQLPLMSKIYSMATFVFAWLGEPDGAVERAISWTEAYVEKKKTALSEYWYQLDEKCAHSEEARVEKAKEVFRANLGLQKINESPYWKRLWTFQEFLVSAREPVCVSGRLSFFASTLFHGFDSLMTEGRKMAYKAEAPQCLWDDDCNKLISKTVPADQEWQRFMVKLLLTRDDFLARPMARSDYGRVTIKAFDDRQDDRATAKLIHFLEETKFRECSDPRDRVYGLHGLVPRLSDAFPPNYNSPVEVVMLEATAFLLTSDGSAAAFSQFPLYQCSLIDEGYTSWTFDLNQHRSTLSPYCYESPMVSKLFSAFDGNHPFSVCLQPTPTIDFKARRLGDLGTCLKFSEHPPTVSEQILSLLDIARRERQNLECWVARALVRHVNGQGNYTNEELLKMYNRLPELISKDEDPALGQQEEGSVRAQRRLAYFLMEGIRSLRGRSLFELDGQSGTCDGSAEEGDVVILPQDMGSLLIVRKLDQKTRSLEKGRNYYRIVSNLVYVDALMDGKGLDEELVSKFNDIPLEDFSIL